MKLYAVIDKKAKHFVSVFTSLNDESAERSFLMLLTGEKSVFTDFPEDFVLYKVCDLSFAGSTLSVGVPDCEALENHGFNAGGFKNTEPFKDGSEYDKRWLAMVHSDRFFVEPKVEPENLSADLGPVDKNVKEVY